MPKSVRSLGNLSTTLTEIDKQLTGTLHAVPRKEARILKAARHDLRNAHQMVVGVKWMLEHQTK